MQKQDSDLPATLNDLSLEEFRGSEEGESPAAEPEIMSKSKKKRNKKKEKQQREAAEMLKETLASEGPNSEDQQ